MHFTVGNSDALADIVVIVVDSVRFLMFLLFTVAAPPEATDVVLPALLRLALSMDVPVDDRTGDAVLAVVAGELPLLFSCLAAAAALSIVDNVAPFDERIAAALLL